MYKKSVIIWTLLLGLLVSQVEMNYSYEMRYGNGQQKLSDGSMRDYSYFENLMDLNLQLTEKSYFFTQFEYSDPPIIGSSHNNLNQSINTGYIEYTDESYELRAGNIYTLYGNGLTIYTYQDQNIDYDNSPLGLEGKYYFPSDITLSGLMGINNHEFRSSPNDTIPSLSIENQFAGVEISYYHEKVGETRYFLMVQESVVNGNQVEDLTGLDNAFAHELNERLQAEGLFNPGNDTILTLDYELSWNKSFDNFDLTVNNVFSFYDKIHGDRISGNRFYASVNMELFGNQLVYEYKNYDTPYQIPVYYNPPVGYREANSVLLSRNVRSIDFTDEIGHQIEINRSYPNGLNLLLNLSQANNHGYYSDALTPRFLDLLLMKNVDNYKKYRPFRQIYVETNGWFWDNVYCKIGLDSYEEYSPGGHYRAFTIPSQFTYDMQNGNSIASYLEYQIKEKIYETAESDNYNQLYSSLSFNYQGKWSLTAIYEQENHDQENDIWVGSDLTANIGSSSQISLFYGSQKGGLVCANGSCVILPDFENGLRVTIRSIF